MHDILRRDTRDRGSHERCARALEHFRGPQANGEVIVVLDPRNVAYLADSIAWLLDQGIRNISLNPNFHGDWDDAALGEWRLAYERAADHYAGEYRRGRAPKINVFDGKIRARIQDGYAECDKCGFGCAEIAVAPGGNFYPCARVVGDDDRPDLCIGNARDGFDEPNRLRLILSRGNTVAECSDCPVRGHRCHPTKPGKAGCRGRPSGCF